MFRSLASVYHWLQQLGYSYLSPRARDRRANFVAREPSKIELPARWQALRQQHPAKRARVYFQDESRFGQQETTTKVWARRNSRPTVVRQTEYKHLWVLGAVCPETGYSDGMLSPHLNTKIINLLLSPFSQSLAAHEHAAMIWDGAGFCVRGKLKVPGNMTILQPPAYSQEVNPMENLWRYWKSHYWSDRAYADDDALEQAAIHAWQIAALDPELMEAVCAARHAAAKASDAKNAISDWDAYELEFAFAAR